MRLRSDLKPQVPGRDVKHHPPLRDEINFPSLRKYEKIKLSCGVRGKGRDPFPPNTWIAGALDASTTFCILGWGNYFDPCC